MFAGKAAANQKRLDLLERPARDKHSHLFGPVVNYNCKKHYNIGVNAIKILYEGEPQDPP
jgi:hypothetical protein